MITPAQFQKLALKLPLLLRAPNAMVQDLQRAATVSRLPKGRDVLLAGVEVDSAVLLLSGVVRVYQIGASGREITLYRFGEGESCILTANAILSRQNFPANATVEQDVEAVSIPAEEFRAWMGKYEIWREFVFSLLMQRLSSVMAIVDEVTFRRMDARVAGWLLEKAQTRTSIHVTHQEIAAELGSSREVISRILEGFATRGFVRIERGTLYLDDPAALREVAAL